MPTPIADMIEEMLKNCIPTEMIISAVRAFERATSTRHQVDTAAEKRRSWDREYRRKKREIPPDIHPTSGGFHPTQVESALSSFTSLSFTESKRSSEEVSKKESKKIERGTKIPPDWKPKQQHYDEGQKLGLSQDDVDDRATRMREWCEANANRSVTTKANWDAAFMGAWLRGGNYGHRAGNQKTTGHDAILAAATRKARELVGDGGLAGTENPDEFSFGNGTERTGASRTRDDQVGSQSDHFRGKPDDQRIIEGEIIAPDKNAARVSRGR